MLMIKIVNVILKRYIYKIISNDIHEMLHYSRNFEKDNFGSYHFLAAPVNAKLVTKPAKAAALTTVNSVCQAELP